MSELIKKLLQGARVEWKSLGEVLVRTKGTKITASQMKDLHKRDGSLKIFAGGKTYALVNFSDIPEKNINYKPSIIVKSRGIIEFEYYERPFSHKNEMWSYHSNNNNIIIKYVYYYLKIKELIFQNIGSKMQMPQIATPDTDNFQIPIPPLSVQAEIVRILDAFTALTAELTAELTMRQKQYNHYRDTLLTFKDDEVEWKVLGDIVKSLKTGLNPRKNFVLNTFDAINFYVTVREIQNGKIVFVDKTDKVNNEALKLINNRSNLEVGDILFSGTGTIGRTAVVESKPENWNIKEGVYVIKPKQQAINSKYLSYLLGSKNIIEEYNKKIVGSPVVSLPMSELKKLKIPIPPLAEQERIVSILDKFDTLTTSITEGLPREIALRKQQYEYYREQLLDFPK